MIIELPGDESPRISITVESRASNKKSVKNHFAFFTTVQNISLGTDPPPKKNAYWASDKKSEENHLVFFATVQIKNQGKSTSRFLLRFRTFQRVKNPKNPI